VGIVHPGARRHRPAPLPVAGLGNIKLTAP
jgi:hypothetical protein